MSWSACVIYVCRAWVLQQSFWTRISSTKFEGKVSTMFSFTFFRSHFCFIIPSFWLILILILPIALHNMTTTALLSKNFWQRLHRCRCGLWPGVHNLNHRNVFIIPNLILSNFKVCDRMLNKLTCYIDLNKLKLKLIIPTSPSPHHH